MLFLFEVRQFDIDQFQFVKKYGVLFGVHQLNRMKISRCYVFFPDMKIGDAHTINRHKLIIPFAFNCLLGDGQC